MSAYVTAIIVAAGHSLRMGTSDSKQFIPLLGKPAIQYTLTAFEKCRLIDEIVVVCRPQDYERINEIAEQNSFKKISAIVNGGDSRSQSVKNGIEAASVKTQYFAIHDGARPLITPVEIERVIEAALESGAATLGTPVTDTIKIVDDHEVSGDTEVIVSTPDRGTLRAVQTPQVFEKELYSFAVEKAGDELDSFTDDCSLVENMGCEVYLVWGEEENIKLTTPLDIVIAESILKARGEGK